MNMEYQIKSVYVYFFKKKFDSYVKPGNRKVKTMVCRTLQRVFAFQLEDLIIRWLAFYA